jgi:hypothetical protein
MISINGISVPIMTPPSPNEWPNTIQSITGLTRDVNAQITVPNHGFTAADAGVTTVWIQQVRGMTQINGLPGLIQSIVDTNNFTVNVNSTNFFSYTSGGIINLITGEPPATTQGFQIFNTPWHNTA